MLYRILIFIIQVALRVFFTSKKIKGKENIPPLGVPLLVVSNHPNTFMDPLLIAHFLKQEVYVLANASVFNSSFNRWFLRQLNMIPIQRKEDSNKVKYSNDEVFRKCFEHLSDKGTILIFPEGTSIHGRRLQKIKSGASRIALGAESENKFELGLHILPIGLNYSKPESFRSEVFIQVGTPINSSLFKQDYQLNPEETVKALTEQIEDKLAKLIIITDDHEEDLLAKNIEKIYKSQLNESITLSEKPKEQNFLMTRGIVDAINHFEEHEPERVEGFRPKIHRYLQNLQRLKLNDEWFGKNRQDKSIFWNSLRDILFLALGFPLYVYGLLNGYIPYIIPSFLAVRMTKYDEYIAPIMMVIGIFTFGIFYPLQIFLVYYFSSSFWVMLLYAISLPISAFFALYYAHELFSARDKFRLFALFYKRNYLVAGLIAERKTLIKDLEKAKNDYLTFYEN
jgi:1-acyl-sn-glycerol-3-phosphate acyltransferase